MDKKAEGTPSEAGQPVPEEAPQLEHDNGEEEAGYDLEQLEAIKKHFAAGICS